MTDHCPECGEKLKENAEFCGNCGQKISKNYKGFFNRFTIAVIIVLVILAIFVSVTYVSNQTQVVKVDNVQFELPSDYVNEPSRTDVNYDQGVKSSAMGWSNEKHYIEIGVTRSPGEGVNSKKVAADLGGSPKKMFGYTGYYLEYENEGCAFVFGIRDEVCMVYVSDYDAFDDVKVLGAV